MDGSILGMQMIDARSTVNLGSNVATLGICGEFIASVTIADYLKDAVGVRQQETDPFL